MDTDGDHAGEAFRVTECFAPRRVAYLGVYDGAGGAGALGDGGGGDSVGGSNSGGGSESGGWRIKMYSIVYGDGPLDRARFEAGVEMAFQGLPMPAVTSARPGVGFMILHQGRGADYVVLAWWDNENELPIRVYVRRQPGTAGPASGRQAKQANGPHEWRAARGSESVCVWDLEIIWAERETYVRTVIGKAGGAGDGVEGYLAAVRR